MQILALERAEVAQRDQAKALEIANQRMEASLTIAREQMVTLKVWACACTAVPLPGSVCSVSKFALVGLCLSSGMGRGHPLRVGGMGRHPLPSCNGGDCQRGKHSTQPPI